MSEQYGWYEPSKQKNVVIPAVQAVAVYNNNDGDVVIIQQDGNGHGDDSVVVVPRSNAKALAKAILDASKT